MLFYPLQLESKHFLISLFAHGWTLTNLYSSSIVPPNTKSSMLDVPLHICQSFARSRFVCTEGCHLAINADNDVEKKKMASFCILSETLRICIAPVVRQTRVSFNLMCGWIFYWLTIQPSRSVSVSLSNNTISANIYRMSSHRWKKLFV